MPNLNKQDSQSKLKQIGKLLSEQEQDDYESLIARVSAANALFQDLLAARLTPAFNAHIAEQPSQTLEQKQVLAQRVNAELRGVGLAIRCPRTGKPAILRGDHGGNPERGRFQTCLVGDSNFARTRSFAELIHLDLMGDRSSGIASETPPQMWADKATNDRTPHR